MTTILAGLGLWFAGALLGGAVWLLGGAVWMGYHASARRWQDRQAARAAEQDGIGCTSTASVPRPARKLDARAYHIDRRPRLLDGTVTRKGRLG
jgi:hypothetical protein